MTVRKPRQNAERRRKGHRADHGPVTSLSAFVYEPDAAACLRANFTPLLPAIRGAILVPATKGVDFGAVGTAYDYWLRSQLAANIAQTLLGYRICQERYRNEPEVMRLLERHILAFSSEGSNAMNSDALLSACLYLAKFETEYRSGYPIQDFGVSNTNLAELRAVSAKTTLSIFRPGRPTLNPVFTVHGSKLTIRADGDLIVNGVLVDLKTTSKIELRDHLKQLVGYAVLNGLVEPHHQFDQIGVYYARFDKMLTFKLTELMNERQWKDVSHFFRSKLGAPLKPH
jgi:hypothetical protein